MHGKPNAKLVPARLLDGLMSDGAGFAGFAAGAIGQEPHHPDLAAMPDVRIVHAAAVAAERRAARVRRVRRGRGVALLPAHDPAPPARARPRARVRVHARRGARVLPRPQARGRDDRAGRQARHARAALLRHARAVAQPRLRVRGRAQPDVAGLEQLRDRSRGRQRPVRAELRLRRRADDLRPGDLLPLHGRDARAGARPDRHVHAQAVLAPDRQRLPLPHEPVARRRERVRARAGRRPARARPVRGGVQLHRRAEGAREGVHRDHGADRDVVQAARGRDAERVELGAGLRQLRLQQPHADAARAGGGARRGPHGRRVVQPLPGRGRGAGGRARRHRARARPGRADDRAEPARADRRAPARAGRRDAAREPARRDARARARRRPAHRPSGRPTARTTSTTS